MLTRWIPAGAVVLEVGLGAGRWSEFLVERASGLVLVDVSERPLELCRERFNDDARIQYILLSGSDLPGAVDGLIDAVWSFDVFVHVSPRNQAGYLEEIVRVLAPVGTAVVHHSDGRNRGQLPSRHGWRSPMSRGLFAVLAAERGLKVECQLDLWGLLDAMTSAAMGMPSLYANVGRKVDNFSAPNAGCLGSTRGLGIDRAWVVMVGAQHRPSGKRWLAQSRRRAGRRACQARRRQPCARGGRRSGGRNLPTRRAARRLVDVHQVWTGYRRGRAV